MKRRSGKYRLSQAKRKLGSVIPPSNELSISDIDTTQDVISALLNRAKQAPTGAPMNLSRWHC